MDEEKLERAIKVYEDLCAALDSHDWHYREDEENLTIESGAQGDDLPMEITIRVDAGRQLIILISHMPLMVDEYNDKFFAISKGLLSVHDFLTQHA